jgi:hypothetical protein
LGGIAKYTLFEIKSKLLNHITIPLPASHQLLSGNLMIISTLEKYKQSSGTTKIIYRPGQGHVRDMVLENAVRGAFYLI